jgi:hypothetical protein
LRKNAGLNVAAAVFVKMNPPARGQFPFAGGFQILAEAGSVNQLLTKTADP